MFELWLLVSMKSNLCVMVGVKVLDMSHLITTNQDISLTYSMIASAVGIVFITLTVVDNYPRFSVQ